MANPLKRLAPVGVGHVSRHHDVDGGSQELSLLLEVRLGKQWRDFRVQLRWQLSEARLGRCRLAHGVPCRGPVGHHLARSRDRGRAGRARATLLTDLTTPRTNAAQAPTANQLAEAGLGSPLGRPSVRDQDGSNLSKGGKRSLPPSGQNQATQGSSRRLKRPFADRVVRWL